jgi:translation initiation factor 3 subunit C
MSKKSRVSKRFDFLSESITTLRHVQNPDAYERSHAPTSVAQVSAPAPSPGHERDVDDFTTVGKGGKVMQITSEGIFKNLQAIQEARGKKV